MDRWCGRQEPEKVEGYLPTLRSFVNFFFEFVGCWGKEKMQFSFFENKRIRTAIRNYDNKENYHDNNENENVAC